MTEFLLRLFVKDYNNTENPEVRASVGKLAGITGIICNCLLFFGKLIAGTIAGSVSIIADAVNNLSDASSSLVTLLGFRLAQRPADKDHPYGHARYEYLSGLVVSAFILLIGIELVKNSIDKIINPEAVELSVLGFTILVGSILVKLWMSLFFKVLGKHINSTTLKATSADSRNDVISTVAVLAGCLVSHFFGWKIDGYIGLLVALFIIYSGFTIARETISPLIGKKTDEELEENISQLILSHEKILGIHDLLVHDYGPGKYFASVHAEMNAEENPLVCHNIIDTIERDVLEKLKVNLVIHCDPVVINDDELNHMREVVCNIIQKIDFRMSLHDFQLIRDTQHKKLIFDVTIPYSMSYKNCELKNKIDEYLQAEGKHYDTVIHFDRKD